jgi:hypothetical protein
MLLTVRREQEQKPNVGPVLLVKSEDKPTKHGGIFSAKTLFFYISPIQNGVSDAILQNSSDIEVAAAGGYDDGTPKPTANDERDRVPIGYIQDHFDTLLVQPFQAHVSSPCALAANRNVLAAITFQSSSDGYM